VQGSVELRQAGANWQAAELNATLCAGDMVRVHQRSRAALLLSNETTLRLDQGTALLLVAPDDKKATLLEQISGGLHVITRTPKAFRVKTPFVNANVEGTEFAIRVMDNDANISVYEGHVVAENDLGSVAIASGEGAVATKSAALRKEIVVRPRDAVAWALYFPTIFHYDLSAETSGAATESARRRSIELYRSGKVADALAALENVGEAEADSGFLNYRAGLLLLVGRLDEAKPDLERALRLSPNSADAYALLAVIAVVDNDKDKALELASKAVGLDLKSPAALVALSYAQQAHFKIEQALASVQKAIDLDAPNALAWARLAELEMSQGRLDRAVAAAQKAVTLNPSLARAQSVLGFTHLTRIDAKAATEAFSRAIALDQADPLPRLGLGLATIRTGDLAAGREQLEIATSLGPTDSLIRSYLGKAYFDEKRDRVAKTQFGMSKQIDPNDPTPWFYEAVLSQSSNHPGEALQSIQTSIEKNGNRAVSRSSLLLDDDLAARSVSQASIYHQLGFDQLAIYEGYRALAADPVNFSAHRFLAEAYTDRPRHAFARENEALQAQMLQPINLYPLQLPLTATESGAFGTSILFDPGFSEYDRLFVRDGIQLQALGLVGTRGTRADQVLISGVANALSYSLGQFYYATDGFRTNAQARNELYDAFLQFSPTERSSLHLEWRHVSTNQGDRVLRFDPDYVTDFRVGQKKDLTRLGGRQQLGDGTTLLVSLGRQTSQDTTDSESFGGRVFTSDRTDRLVEMQIAHRSEGFHARAGFGNLSGSELTDFFGTSDQHAQKSHNIYVYATWGDLPAGIRLEGGVSRDYVKDPLLAQEFKQTNYKVGLGWDVTAATALRIATFRVLKRTGLAELTIEPTQVMGFNQFYDDFNGTSARRTALALDHRFSDKAFAGIELTRRDLRVPQAFVDPIRIFDWQERSHTAYASFLPQRWLAINVAYRYEVFERSPDLNGLDDFIRVRTQRLPVTVSMTTSESTSLRLRLTPIRQDGTFLHSDLTPFDGRSSFAVADAMATYHLPKRYGTLTLGVQNLLDKRARFQETDVSAPTITPQRFIFTRLSLAF
jgi:tetratricopeptide (TPR) repeat protein